MPDSRQTLVTTTLAGSVASLAESYITYPLEYLKVREQIALRSGTGERFAIPNLTKVFFHGSTIFAMGNVAKTAVRFGTFNWATKFMSDHRPGQPAGGPISAPQVVVAGILTGIAETMVVVPCESIKTTMIEASAIGLGAATGTRPIPGSEGTIGIRPQNVTSVPGNDSENASTHRRSRRTRPSAASGASSNLSSMGTSSAIRGSSTGLYEVRPLQNIVTAIGQMYRDRGLRAFVQGFNPTVTRQVANSFIRFTTYNMFRQLVAPGGDSGDKSLSLVATTAISGMTAATEAVLTQPVDVVKSRMQTTNGIKLYGNSLLCAYRICSEEGFQRLWAGLLPRWLRIWASGAIMWVAYESSQTHISRAMREVPFQ